LIIGSATPNELLHRAEWPKHPNNKAFDKLGVYSKSSKVADAVIEAQKSMNNGHGAML
jgi:hypothetical protein